MEKLWNEIVYAAFEIQILNSGIFSAVCVFSTGYVVFSINDYLVYGCTAE